MAEDPAKEGGALLADVAEAVLVRGGVDGRRQADVADDVLAAGEARYGAEHQDRGERSEGTDAGVTHQSSGIGIVGRGAGDLAIERINAEIQPVQQLEAVITAATCVRQQDKGVQLREAALRPERRSEGEALIERDRVQAIFDHRADAHEAEPVFDEGTQVTRGRIGNPHEGKALMLEKVEKMPGIAAIRLGLTHDHRADLGRLADDEGMAEPLQERMEPQRIPGAFDADGDGRWERGVELLDGIAGVPEFLLEQCPSVGVEDGHLLLARVQIAADKDHEFGLRCCDVVVPWFAEATSDAQPFS